MPWKGVTVSEHRDRFLEDYLLNCYTITDLADRFGISRNTAHRWIARFQEGGRAGYHELSRRPHSCPWQTDPHLADLLLEIRRKHPRWGPRKLLDILQRRYPKRDWPAPSTVARLFSKHGLAHRPRRFRRAHPGCPQSVAKEPNDIWAADYKGQFRLGNSHYCFPLTVSDLHSRFLLGCDAHPEVSLDRTQACFSRLFHTYGLPNRIRTDNGIPFASNALARLSQLSVWFITLGIYPELIEPGKPQQNGAHERMHSTLKREATIPPASSLSGQQRKFDTFRRLYNHERPHESLAMRRPAELYCPSPRSLPRTISTYDYPAHFLVRRVSACGTIRVLHKQPFVSNTLNGDFVGLEEVDDGVYDLFFCFYQIGRYHLRGNRIEDILSRVASSHGQVDLAARVSTMS